jgi:hypothetical protein
MADRLDEHLLPPPLAPAIWSAFDAAWYARAHPQAGGGGFAALRAHYLTQGQAEGLSPVRYFDEAWYRARYPDVAAGIAAGAWRSGFEHYALAGHADRDPHWLFDAAFYGAPDDAGCFNGYDHFLRIGAANGLTGHPLFDPTAHPVPPEAAFGWFLDACRFGVAEPAPSLLFDPAWYRAYHPAAAWTACALEHYLTNPTPTAFDPLPDFVEPHYLAADKLTAALVEAGVYRNGYAHFLALGAAAGRRPAPWIDLEFAGARGLDAFRRILAQPPPRRGVVAAQAAEDVSASASLPLLTRGRLDFRLTAPAALTVLLVLPGDRAQALPSLRAAQAAAPGAVELVLLDTSNQAAGLAVMVSGASVVATPAGGLANACNRALAGTTAPFVLLLDGSTVPDAAGLQAALRRLAADEAVGVAGGPLVGADGSLLEAGLMLRPDGSARCYLRGAPAQISEAGFVRDVDAVGASQMLMRRAMLASTGAFATGMADHLVAADICLRGWGGGYRTVYDPAMAAAVPGLRALRVIGLPTPAAPELVVRHGALLRRPRAPGAADHALRTARAGIETVLLLVPTLPRPSDVATARIAALADDGADVTLLPLDGGPQDPAILPTFLPPTVEIVCGLSEAALPAFLAARGDGFFSRTENLSGD